MQLREFYERLLPAEGRYVLFQNFHNKFFDTLDALVAATEKRLDTQGLYFATATYGDLKVDKPDSPNHGNFARTQENVVALKAFRFDIDAGAEKFAKHPQGAYPSQREALSDLGKFIRATDLWPTLILSSGNGLHVYWQLAESVQPQWWKPLAAKLQAIGRHHGLRIDASCTTDEARVLRPVGAIHKNGTRVAVLKDTGKVYLPADLSAAIEEQAGELPDQFTFELPKRATVTSQVNVNADVLAAVEGPPASLARVAEHCGAVAQMRDTEGNVPEPHWRAVMGVAKYCEDGEQLVHVWSQGYRGYDPVETQVKFDRWETPPTTCAHFDLQTTACASCKHKGKITTPKQLGYIVVQPASAPPILDGTSATTSTRSSESSESIGEGLALEDEPTPAATAACPVPERPDLFDDTQPFFFRVVDGRWTLYHRYNEQSKDATGQTVWITHVKAVCYKLFWVDSNSLPGATDNGGVMVQFGKVERPTSNRQERMEMPAGTYVDVKALSKYLADQGVNLAPRSINRNAPDHIKEYVTREIVRKQNDMRFVIKDRFGYHWHEGQFICSMGPYTVYPDGAVLKTVCNPKLQGLAKALTSTALPDNPAGRWDATAWRGLAPSVAEYITFLRKHYGHAGYAPARLAIAINLASPFLVFAADSVFNDAEEMPAIGFVLSLYSEASGIGKSSLMASIAAAYGKDTLARKANDQSMTAVAAATTAKGTAIYPMLMDEITQNDASRAAQLIDTFANGTGRLRARQDGTVARAAETWALVSCVATNVPQRELLTASQKRSDALLMRLMELSFDGIPPASDIEAFRADLKSVQLKCGAFGLFQALLAVKAGPEKLTAMTAANVTRAFAMLGVDQKFRFFARMLGAMLTNHQLLGKWSPFDMDEIVASFKRAIQDTIWYVAANKNTVFGELAQLLSDMSPNVVVTKSWTKRTGREETHDVVLNQNVRLPILGREVQDWGLVLLDSVAVRKWCTENQMSASGFIDKMQNAGLLVPFDGNKQTGKARLTTGIVGMPTTAGYYFRFRTRPVDAHSAGASNVVDLRSFQTEATTEEVSDAAST